VSGRFDGKVAIITGAGDRAFSVGGDINGGLVPDPTAPAPAANPAPGAGRGGGGEHDADDAEVALRLLRQLRQGRRPGADPQALQLIARR